MKTLAKEIEELARDTKVRQAVRELINEEKKPSGGRSEIPIANTDKDEEPIVIRRANTP